MPVTTFTSREFNQDIGKAKAASDNGPVIVTTRNQPTHVFMTYSEFRRLKGETRNLADALYYPGAENIEFEIPRADIQLKVPDFS